MTRHVFAIEGGTPVMSNTYLKVGSLYIEPKMILPVTRGFDWEGTPIGTAKDLQRDEETGKVSVDISFKEGYELSEEEQKLYDYTFMATHLEEERVEATDDVPAHRLILKAKVRQIALVPLSAHPLHQ